MRRGYIDKDLNLDIYKAIRFCHGKTLEHVKEIRDKHEKESSKKNRMISTLEKIADDQRADAQAFEGRPFTGKVVAEYFGNQGAAIAALAKIIKAVIDD
jgi:hypothetical protein